MRRAVFLRPAQRDLAEIRRWIILESRSIAVAQGFTDRLRAKCHQLAELPGTLGAARPDLGPSPGGEIRSVAMQGYVILFRYLPDRVQIIRILHGQRDLPATVRPPEPMQED